MKTSGKRTKGRIILQEFSCVCVSVPGGTLPQTTFTREEDCVVLARGRRDQFAGVYALSVYSYVANITPFLDPLPGVPASSHVATQVFNLRGVHGTQRASLYFNSCFVLDIRTFYINTYRVIQCQVSILYIIPLIFSLFLQKKKDWVERHT